jgi:cell division septation protein DedD
MEFKFSKGDADGAETQPAAEKKNQTALLVLLLILVGGFSYVYFFTGLIKPQEAPKPAEAPAKTQVVKMPLPPSDGGTVKTDAKPVDAKPADAKKEAPAAPKAEPPKASVAAAVPPAKTPAPPAAKPKEEPKKAEPVKAKEEPKKAETKKAEPAKPKEEPKKAEPAKPADKKPVVAEKKPEPAKADAKKATAAAEPKPKAPLEKSEKPAKTEAAAAASGGPWSVLVGSYVLEDALSADMGRVRKAGLDPVVKPGARKKSAMNRLFLSEFSDRAAAQTVLDKLKRHTSDAFIVEQGGKHAVYAGSYLLDVRAASETERLGAAGFQVTLKRVEIAIPSQSLTVGPFSDKKAADAALGKLKAAGIKATLSK